MEKYAERLEGLCQEAARALEGVKSAAGPALRAELCRVQQGMGRRGHG